MAYRINIGCGMTPTKDWLNYDNSLALRLSRLPGWFIELLRRIKIIDEAQFSYVSFCRKNSIIFCDATKRIPLPDDSVEILYSSHMLEHLDSLEAQAFLKESYRILFAGGIIRIAVPGLLKKIEQYWIDKDADLFMQSLYTCINKPITFRGRLKLALVGPRHHHWMYDEQSLSRLLESIGFRDAIALPAGKTAIKNPEYLNLSERVEESIYIEARK